MMPGFQTFSCFNRYRTLILPQMTEDFVTHLMIKLVEVAGFFSCDCGIRMALFDLVV